jgi:hypothetical protein
MSVGGQPVNELAGGQWAEKSLGEEGREAWISWDSANDGGSECMSAFR